MKRIKRIFAAFIALLILTSFAAVSVFAEDESSSPDESSTVTESTSSAEEPSSSSAEEQSSSSAEDKSSSSEEKSESSEEESESSEEESESSEEEVRSSSSSSSAEEAFAQTVTHEETGISIGLAQKNDKLLIEAKSVSANDKEYSEVYAKLLGASKDKELVCCYEVILGGDETFSSKVTIAIPVDEDLIDRSMVVLFYAENAKRVETSNKTVSKIGLLSSSGDDSDEEPEIGYLKVSEKLEAGKKYYFAVCEFADYVPVSNGFGLLEILVIVIAVAAVASGGLLAFLWVRYNKKQNKAK